MLLTDLAGDTGADALTSILVQAVVQGLTEFLPVSSSGHLVLAREVLGTEGPGLVQSIALHLGTLVAVLVVYARDLRRLVQDALGGDWRGILVIGLGTLPAVAVGLFLKRHFEAQLEDPTLAAVGLLVTSALLVWGERCRRRSVRRRGAGTQPRTEPGWIDALVIGSFQALAILPGISRSGSTIASGISRGLEPGVAARFSFLLSIPAIGGAALLEGLDAVEGGLGGVEPGTLLLGAAVSAAVGWCALRLLLVLLERAAFLWFAFYCAALGLSWLLLH